MVWPASDSAYYGARNGDWANLAGVFAAPLGADDNYVTDAEKAAIGTLGSYALASDVLTKTNTTPFTPTADHHPATMKFVLDSVTAGGGYTDEQAQDAAGAMFSGNTETGITVIYDDETNKVNLAVPTTLAGFTDDTTHRLVTDTQIGTWNAKQNPLIAGTDYLTPVGIGASLTFTATGFNGNLATTVNTVQELADAVDDLSAGSGTDDQTAAEVPIADSGGYYTATNVEDALAERGADPFIAWDTATITEQVGVPSARTNTIGVKANTFQAYDADWLGITANGAALISTSYAAMRALLDLEVGTDFNAYSTILAAWSGISPSTGSINTTGAVQAKVPINSYSAAQTLTQSTHNSSIVQMTVAAEVTMWDCEVANVGDTVMLWARDAEKIEVIPASGDHFALFGGTALTADYELDMAAIAGTKVTLMCTADDTWSVYAETSASVDGGVAD